MCQSSGSWEIDRHLPTPRVVDIKLNINRGAADNILLVVLLSERIIVNMDI